jgi:hypothetical protein
MKGAMADPLDNMISALKNKRIISRGIIQYFLRVFRKSIKSLISSMVTVLVWFACSHEI